LEQTLKTAYLLTVMETLQVSIILEILGRPVENVKDAMGKIISQIAEEEGVKLLAKKDNEPVLAKDATDLYTTFSELTLELDSLNHLFGLVFKYLPSNIEVVEPERLKLRNDEINNAVNQLTQRMHGYDAITKNLVAERDFLAKKLMQHEPELFKDTKLATEAEKIAASKKEKEKSPKKGKKKKKN